MLFADVEMLPGGIERNQRSVIVTNKSVESLIIPSPLVKSDDGSARMMLLGCVKMLPGGSNVVKFPSGSRMYLCSTNDGVL
jgi:hypothetical protein